MMIEEFAALKGRSISRGDRADSHRWEAYHGFFGLDPHMPPMALHWMLFTSIPDETRPDGHPAVMQPFPVLPYPRRMWGGGEVNWIAPIALEQELLRETVVAVAEPKSGAAGDFLLTSLRHRITGGAEALIEERQDVVFLPAATKPGAAAPRPVPFEPAWSEERRFDSVTLFRYSALTLNGHRIHYDAVYAREVEHYAGLVVHGPLLASLLMQAAARRRASEKPVRFSYRAVAPVFVHDVVRLVGVSRGESEELAIVGPDEGMRMTATMTYSGIER